MKPDYFNGTIAANSPLTEKHFAIMKRILAIAFVAALITVPSAFALTVTLQGGNGYGPYQAGVGGEFTFAISDTSLISHYGELGGPVNVSSIPNSFQTFCVEGPEYIYPNATYTAQLNHITQYGNVALTRGAAWLYSQFAQGSLSGYNYTGDRLATAALLQNAIWAFMGQEGQVVDPIHNAFEMAAINALLTLGLSPGDAASTGEFGVYVLNLWDETTTPGRTNPAQDQLIYAPQVNPNSIGVPDGGTTAMLLGLGFSAVAVVSRRVRRS